MIPQNVHRTENSWVSITAIYEDHVFFKVRCVVDWTLEKEFKGYLNPKTIWWKPWTLFRLSIPDALHKAIYYSEEVNKEIQKSQKRKKANKNMVKEALNEARQQQEIIQEIEAELLS